MPDHLLHELEQPGPPEVQVLEDQHDRPLQ